jgi:hypothetical protein
MPSDDEAQDNGGQASASGEGAEPTREELYKALIKVRRHGVGNPDKPLLDLVSLRWVARSAGEKIEDMPERAIERLGGKDTAAVQALLGFAADTRGHELAFRREKAAERHDYKDPQSFRTHHEKELLTAVATQLVIFVDKQRLEDWERRLMAQQDRLIEAQRRLIEHNGDRLPHLEQALLELQDTLPTGVRPLAKHQSARVRRAFQHRPRRSGSD